MPKIYLAFSEASDNGKYENFGKILNLKGAVSLNLGETEKALIYFQKASALEPDTPEFLYNYGLCLKNSGKPAEALRAYDKAIALDRKPEYLRSKAMVLSKNTIFFYRAKKEEGSDPSRLYTKIKEEALDLFLEAEKQILGKTFQDETHE